MTSRPPAAPIAPPTTRPTWSARPPVGTATWHVGHVLAKLGAASRIQALVRAQQAGLV